jgi:hypothetical protein
VLLKAGRVLMTQSWLGVPTNVVLDFRAEVENYGDHGATAIIHDKGFLYITYSKLNPIWGQHCADYGQPDRPLPEITGCPVFGRLSRWAVSAAGVIAGQEQVLFDSEFGGAAGGFSSQNKACGQFSTHSVPAGLAMLNDDFYISLGDGAAFTMLDFGELGLNPCGDADAFKGAFRSQDPRRFNGKVLRLDPLTFAPTIMTSGHRNPFRLAAMQGDIYATETGWYSCKCPRASPTLSHAPTVDRRFVANSRPPRPAPPQTRR